jgi:hypothetical protein
MARRRRCGKRSSVRRNPATMPRKSTRSAPHEASPGRHVVRSLHRERLHHRGKAGQYGSTTAGGTGPNPGAGTGPRAGTRARGYRAGTRPSSRANSCASSGPCPPGARHACRSPAGARTRQVSRVGLPGPCPEGGILVTRGEAVSPCTPRSRLALGAPSSQSQQAISSRSTCYFRLFNKSIDC